MAATRQHGAHRTEGGQGARHHVRSLRHLLAALLRAKLRDGRLRVLPPPDPPADLQDLPLARLHVEHAQPDHLYGLQPELPQHVRAAHLLHLLGLAAATAAAAVRPAAATARRRQLARPAEGAI